MDLESGRPLKRFKHQSYQATLKSVHLPSASAQSRLDDDIPDSESHFHNALDHWRQLSLSPAFLRFATQVHTLSASVPLLLHHSKEVVTLWIQATNEADDDALKALLDLLQKLLHDLRTTLSPFYTPLLQALLSPLPRSQSADTFTVLLATLSSFFKHLLGSTTQAVKDTWFLLTAVIPKCNVELQRAVAEVWAATLRRSKGEMRKTVVALILRDLEIIADGGAWMFVYAFKSVAHTLHTCTSALFEELLSVHLSPHNRTRTESLLRRVITALVHHCDKPEQFFPISDLLISRFIGVTSEELPYLMSLLSIAFSVRKGSRIHQRQLSRVLIQLSNKDYFLITREPVITLGTAALVAGEMPVWMGPGRRFIEASWEVPSLGLELSGVLSDLDWGGWRLIELPFTLKHTAQLIDTHSKPTLALLASLARSGRLDDVDEGWLRRLTTSVQTRLRSWIMSEDNMAELAAILTLSPILSSIRAELSSIASYALDTPEAECSSEQPNWPEPLAAKVFGACAKGLAKIPRHEWSEHVDVRFWIISAVKKWAGCQGVLEGLVAVSRQDIPGCRIPLKDLYLCVRSSILSQSSHLRLHTLELLSSPLVERVQSDEALSRCLQGERATLDVQGVRERVIKLTGAPQVLQEGDELGADICTRWLVAQLKVNLRPIWRPAMKALAVLSQRFPEKVWKLIFSELDATIRGDYLQSPESHDSPDDKGPEKEAERSWRDPSAANLRLVVNTWLNVSVSGGVFQTPCQRLDTANYEDQLLQALGEIASLTQRNNAELIRLFLSFGSPDLPSKLSRAKLSSWLTLFSKLDNPKALHQTSTLQRLYRSLLSRPDRNLQSLALSCLLNYKLPHLVSYETHLRAFLDNTKWRDELTSFDISAIQEEDRFEVVDITVRLFFGLMLERQGHAKGVDRRASLLGALGGCRDEELRPLIDLMLEPFSMSSSSVKFADNLSVESMEKQQIGFMNFLGDVLKRIGSRIVPYWHSLILTTVELVAWAQAKLETIPGAAEHQGGGDVEDEAGVAVEDMPSVAAYSNTRPTRTVRQLGIKRFTDFFRCNESFDFTPYLPSAFSAFISPRLASLERESTQSPSAILELFYTWSTQRNFVSFLVDYDDRILPKTYACLRAVNIKPAVVSRVFDIVEHILAFSEDDGEVADRILKPHITHLLDALTFELPNIDGLRSDLLHRQVAILSQIAPFTSSASQARHLLQHFSPLLRRPSRIIPEKTKAHLLSITQGIIPLLPDFNDRSSALYVQTYEMFAKLFQTLRSKSARLALSNALFQLSVIDPSLRRVSNLLASLNAFSTKRIDEPDFNSRLQAFAELNEVLYTQLSPQEWHPVLYNMLQSIQDPEELAIRTNAAHSLKRFIDILSIGDSPDLESLFKRTLFPALKNGLLSKIELVRSEILGVLAYAISKCDSISSLSELRPLLANGDNEANFFNNIYHIQTHRRTRALRRLVEYVEGGCVRGTTLSEIFLPLISHFIVNAPTTDHILVDVAVATTGSLACRLSWGAYNASVRQYMMLIKGKTAATRACVRTLVAILENFHFPMDDVAADEETCTHDESVAAQTDNAEQVTDTEVHADTGALTTGVPSARIADAVNSRLLPSLLQHLEGRDDNEDALRIPMSIAIAQVACHLPQSSKEVQILRLLTLLCQVFRSKSQDTRALAREALCKVAVIIGSSYLPKIITELRAALLRGPHLHILANVTHALLVRVTSPDVAPSFSDLDACAIDVAHISAEVIFGQSGHDVRSEDFKTTILEVRGSSSKGLDSFAILAQYITPSLISAILSPIRAIMHETETPKTLQLVDDLLRRISGGINANKYLTPPELLLLCHTLIHQNARFLKEAPRTITAKERTKGHIMVQMKRRLGKDEDHYAHNSFRFIAFGLDLFNTAFRRGRFNFQDSHTISRLEPMVAVIGNTLYSHSAPVAIQGLKATAYIVKAPLKAVERSLPVFVRQTLEIVRQSGNIESEVAQAAFRTLAVIIRDCAATEVSEKDLSYLLEVLAPDLEEPTRQAAVFGLLRAIVSRKFVVAEIYDIMDKVAEIMVTNQAAQVRELCRVVLLQFLLDYPQGKGRLRNQMTFLAQNLSYVFESGRRSVMELLGAVFTKFDRGLLHEYADLFFIALVMVLANDDSSKCREMAAELIKLLFSCLDADHRRVIISHLHSWSSGKAQLQLSRVSAQIYGLMVDTSQQEVLPYLPGLIEDMDAVIRRSAMEFQELELSANDVSCVDVDTEWQLPYHALNVINKVFQVFPAVMKEEGKIDWSAVRSHLLFPHAWVRNVSSRLIGLLFSTAMPERPDPNLPDRSPMSFSGYIEVARSSCFQLRSDTLDSSLSLQVVKNLFYVGKCFCMIANGTTLQYGLGRDLLNSQEAELDSEACDKLESIRNNPLAWLFSKLSYQTRSAWLARRNQSIGQVNWSEQPLAVFRWFAAMASHMDPALLETYLVHILSPVYRILDDDTIHDDSMGDLKTLAQELLELVQNRVGTTKFVSVYNQIKQGITAVRRERKNEKIIQATKNPQASARRKIKRNLAKKDRGPKKHRILAYR